MIIGFSTFVSHESIIFIIIFIIFFFSFFRSSALLPPLPLLTVFHSPFAYDILQTTNNTSQNKLIPRYPHKRLSELKTKYLVFVRLQEELFAPLLYPTFGTSAARVYRHYAFVKDGKPWLSHEFSKQLSHFTRKYMGVSLGVQEWRHAAAGLGKELELGIIDPNEQKLSSAMALQQGHSQETSTLIYAVHANQQGSCDSIILAVFCNVSDLWHVTLLRQPSRRKHPPTLRQLTTDRTVSLRDGHRIPRNPSPHPSTSAPPLIPPDDYVTKSDFAQLSASLKQNMDDLMSRITHFTGYDKISAPLLPRSHLISTGTGIHPVRPPTPPPSLSALPTSPSPTFAPSPPVNSVPSSPQKPSSTSGSLVVAKPLLKTPLLLPQVTSSSLEILDQGEYQHFSFSPHSVAIC